MLSQSEPETWSISVNAVVVCVGFGRKKHNSSKATQIIDDFQLHSSSRRSDLSAVHRAAE